MDAQKNSTGDTDQAWAELRQTVMSMQREAPPELESPDPETPEGRIFQAALELFAENGFDGTSTRAIAERANVNLAMIHYYFGTKVKLYRRIVSSAIRTIFKKVALDRIDMLTPEEFLLTYPARVMAVFRNHPLHARVMQSEIAGGARHLRETIAEMGPFGPLGFRNLFSMVYSAGVDRNTLHDLPPMDILRIMLATAFGLFLAAPFAEYVTGADYSDEAFWDSQMKTLSFLMRNGLSTEAKP